MFACLDFKGLGGHLVGGPSQPARWRSGAGAEKLRTGSASSRRLASRPALASLLPGWLGKLLRTSGKSKCRYVCIYIYRYIVGFVCVSICLIHYMYIQRWRDTYIYIYEMERYIHIYIDIYDIEFCCKETDNLFRLGT